jgi:hypothetical protein
MYAESPARRGEVTATKYLDGLTAAEDRRLTWRNNDVLLRRQVSTKKTFGGPEVNGCVGYACEC